MHGAPQIVSKLPEPVSYRHGPLRADPEVLTSSLDDELVLYDPRTGFAHTLNVTGAHIWNLCDGSHRLASVAHDVATTYRISDGQALADVTEFVRDLDQAGLLARE
jgi:PqqD family protein of HPr-rel-A system